MEVYKGSTHQRPLVLQGNSNAPNVGAALVPPFRLLTVKKSQDVKVNAGGGWILCKSSAVASALGDLSGRCEGKCLHQVLSFIVYLKKTEVDLGFSPGASLVAA